MNERRMFARVLTAGAVLAAPAVMALPPTASAHRSPNAAPIVSSTSPATPGRWVDVGPMPVSTNDHTLVQLHDGRVLAIGSGPWDNGQWSCRRAASLFDPATDTWTRTGRLHRHRCFPAIAALPDGTVMVAGGRARRATHSVEIYDPTTGRWHAGPRMHHARSWPISATLPRGRVLVAGGTNRRGRTLTSSEIYNPRTEQWHAAGPLPVPMEYPSSIRLHGGGVLAVAYVGHHRTMIAARYRVARRAWVPAGRFRGAADELFLRPTGNVLAFAHPGARMHTYYAGANHWGPSMVPSPPLPADAVLSWARQPLVVGVRPPCGRNDATTRLLRWQPHAHRWTQVTTAPYSAMQLGVLRLRDRSILVTGGTTLEICAQGANPMRLDDAYRFFPSG